MTTESTYKRPLPMIDRPATAPYWAGAKIGELRLQKCAACAHIWFPPSICCPKCLGEDYAWVKASGKATLWSWIDMWQLYFPGFADERPYTVAYVKLEEGPMMMSGLMDYDRSELAIDMPLEVVFDAVTKEVTLPKFRPVKK